MDNQLVKVIEQTGITTTKSEMILSNFTKFFEEAKEWETKAVSIIVKSETDMIEMKKARDARLALKEIRVNAERVRKELKEQSLREGKAIDGIANVIKAIIVPIEKHLEKQEKFIEYRKEAEREKINIFRISALQQYVDDVNMFNLRDMSEAGFNQLLNTSKLAREAEKEAERKAEKERIVKENADKKEKERIQQENEKFKQEAEIASAEKNKIEVELREKEEKEARIKRRKIEEARKAKIAPDKDKIYAFSNAIASINVPQCKSNEAQTIIETAEAEIRIACKKMCESIEAI